MAAKVHKSLRLDASLVERVEALRNESEPLSNAMCRVMAVGCDTLEGAPQNGTVKHAVAQPKSTEYNDESTRKLIALLEKDVERLEAEHEADKATIAEKDRQIAAALEKAHELTSKAHELADQSHVLIGMSQEAKQLPHGDGGEIVDVKPVPEKISFTEWWKNYR